MDWTGLTVIGFLQAWTRNAGVESCCRRGGGGVGKGRAGEAEGSCADGGEEGHFGGCSCSCRCCIWIEIDDVVSLVLLESKVMDGWLRIM